MMNHPKTTIIGIVTGLVAVLSAGLAYLKTGTVDGQTVVTGVLGILAALGLYHAADGGA